MEPVNHVTIYTAWYSRATPECGTIIEDVFYKDYPDFLLMRGQPQSPETKAEHAAWWAWYEAAGGTSVEINEKG